MLINDKLEGLRMCRAQAAEGEAHGSKELIP